MTRVYRIVVTLAVLSIVATIVGAVVFANRIPTVSQVDASQISIDRGTGNRVYQNLPFSGLAITEFPDGVRHREEEFSNGRRHGVVKHWFADGQLAFESYYQFGRREGLTSSWWSNGNKRSITNYLADQPDGVAWRWYRSGEKFKRFNYEEGRPVGIQQGWRQNGKLFSNFEYRNGRTYGLRNSNLCVTLEDEEISFDSPE